MCKKNWILIKIDSDRYGLDLSDKTLKIQNYHSFENTIFFHFSRVLKITFCSIFAELWKKLFVPVLLSYEKNILFHFSRVVKITFCSILPELACGRRAQPQLGSARSSSTPRAHGAIGWQQRGHATSSSNRLFKTLTIYFWYCETTIKTNLCL